jgi:hypothetical protein
MRFKKITGIFPFIVLIIYSGSCKSFEKSIIDSSEKSEKGKIEKLENVVFIAIDRGSSDPADDKTVYYKIYLNKELVLKTSSGLFFQKKSASLTLEPGRYLFFAERWYLDEDPEIEVPEYKRANNVWQMKPVYLDVPEPPQNIKAVFGIDYDKSGFYLDIMTEE